MQDQESSQGGIAPVAGGAAAAGAAAATLAYAGGAVSGGGLFSNQSATYSSLAASGTSGLSDAEASRFLLQATNGASRQDIDLVKTIGISTWLAQQFSTPRSQSHWNFLNSLGPMAQNPFRGVAAGQLWDRTIWRQLIAAPDQLRQRVALALLDIMVIGYDGMSERFPQYAMAAYMDLLLDHAFGNFRNLLGAITTNSAMSQYLTFLTSRKEEPGILLPDENYARELMQLFTLGLHQLDIDGTVKVDRQGVPIDTYSEADVSQLARVFTGLRLNGSDAVSPDVHRRPLIINPSENETGPSTFLGKTVSGGGMGAINAALDVIFRHPNLPPFFARALIQRLVTSNPSPAYIKRVAMKFMNNGNRVRGDMRAVISAVLTDREARTTAALGAPHTGRLRDTTQRITGWARAFNASSVTGDWLVGDLSGTLLHSPGRSPSVFNFFRPGYTPPNSELQRRGLVAPEMQICDEQSVVAYLNYMYKAIRTGYGDFSADYSPLLAIADDEVALFDEINILVAAGQVVDPDRSLILATLGALPSRSYTTRITRVWTAIMLVMASPKYLILQ